MNSATVWKRITIDAAHFLPGYLGPCARLHGHTYVVELGIEGFIDKTTGMVVDMTHLHQFLKNFVGNKYDHSCLNDSLPNPTAEHMAVAILTAARGVFDTGHVSRIYVRVFETPTSWVEVCTHVRNLLCEA